MATVVTWDLSLKEVEIGKSVEFNAEGLAAFEDMEVVINLPSGGYYIWTVKADDKGRVRDSISLDSGLGQYIFCPKPACGYVNPNCAPLNVCPCSTSATDCNIKIEAPARAGVGDKTALIITGLKPSRYISIKIASNQDVTQFSGGISDVTGRLIYEVQQNLAGPISITVSDGSCISPPHILEIVDKGNSIPAIRAETSNACADAVDANFFFSKTNYAPSESGYLRLVVSNKGPTSREVTLAAEVSLVGATVTSEPFPSYINIRGYGTEEFTLLFKASGTDAVYTASITGSYICSGKIYAINGGSANSSVGNGQGVCGATLAFFGSVNASVEGESEVDADITILNSGNKTIDQVTVSEIRVPEGVTLLTTLPVGVAAIPPNETKTIKVKLKTSATPGYYSVVLPGDKITYRCAGSTTMAPINQTGFLSIEVK